MRVVVQRVSKASVSVEGEVTGAIEHGLLVFLGVEPSDEESDIAWLSHKLPSLRVYEDENGQMNRSLKDVDGAILLISQFTLYGNVKKGTRPSFNRAAPPEIAVPLYERFHKALEQELGKPVPRGVFGAMMHIEAHNDGPVTLIIDSKDRKF